MITALSALVAKDLRLFVRDRRAMILSFVVPFALAALMGGVTGGSGKPEDILIAVTDGDQSDVSKEILAKMGADKTFKMDVVSAEEARLRVGKGQTDVAVLFPAGFGHGASQAFFGGGTRPTLTLLYDPSHSATRAMVEGVLTEHVMEVVSSRLMDSGAGADVVNESLQKLQNDAQMDPARRTALSGLLNSVLTWQKVQGDAAAKPAEGTAKSGGGGGFKVPYETTSEPITAGGAPYNGYSHSFGGMGVQFVLFTGIEMAVAILTERQRGLWRRFRAAPLAKSTLLLSRVLSGAIIATTVFAVLMAGGAAFFHVEVHGSLPGLAVVLAAFGIMCSAFGLMIAAIGKTPQAARGLAVFAVLIMVMLGGAWIPAFLFPPLLQQITLVMPTRWVVDAIDAMTWRGLGFMDIVPAVGVLLGFAVVFGAIGALRFRWDADA